MSGEMSVTPQQTQFFEEHGYLTGLDVHDAGDAARFRDSFDELETREGHENCEIGLQGRHIDERFIWELASQPRILDVIEALMGPDVLVLSTHVFCKYPNARPSVAATQKFVAWHQDVTYWGLEPPYALTAWYAIDDSDVENGCMRVIPGSHRDGIMEHGKSTKPGNLLSINQEVRSEVDDSSAIDLVLQAGQISIHHGHLIHGSNSNRSDRRRCGLTIRYCPPNVKPITANSLGKPWPAVLARGEDRFKNFGEWELQFS
jgi:ectoine hydroxylase-related dioxygenase (phytanoyl-CoA dioxygenase family)